MKSFEYFQLLLQMLPYVLPNMVVATIGLIVSFSRSRRFPRAGRLAVAAFALILFLNFTSIFLPILTFKVYDATNSTETVGWVSFAVGTVKSIINAGALGLLIYALWTERGVDS